MTQKPALQQKLLQSLLISMMLLLGGCGTSYMYNYQSHMEAGNMEIAQSALSKQLQTTPHDPAVNLAMGELKSELGQYSEALIYFEKASNVAGYESDVVQLIEYFYVSELNKGIIAQEAQQIGKAITHFQHASTIKPEAYQPYYQLSYLYALSGEPKKSEEASLNCLRVRPKLSSCAFNLAVVKLNGEHYADAVPYFEQILGDMNDHLPSLWYLSLSYLELGQTDKTEQLFRQMKQYHTSDRKGRNGEAVLTSDESGTLDYQMIQGQKGLRSQDGLQNLRGLQNQSGLQDEAGSGDALLPLDIHSFADTDFSHFHRQIGLKYAEKGEHGLAESHLETALVAFPKDPVVLHLLSEFAFEQSDFRRVIDLTNTLLEQDPKDRSALGKQLLAFEYLNEIDKMSQTETKIDELTY